MHDWRTRSCAAQSDRTLASLRLDTYHAHITLVAGAHSFQNASQLGAMVTRDSGFQRFAGHGQFGPMGEQSGRLRPKCTTCWQAADGRAARMRAAPGGGAFASQMHMTKEGNTFWQ